VSRVANIEAKLTEVTNTVRAHRRPWNALETKADDGDILSGVCIALGEDGSSTGVRVREGRGVGGGATSIGVEHVGEVAGRCGCADGRLERQRELTGGVRGSVGESARVSGVAPTCGTNWQRERERARGTRARAGRCQ
jgi:hypothetical protein